MYKLLFMHILIRIYATVYRVTGWQTEYDKHKYKHTMCPHAI